MSIVGPRRIISLVILLAFALFDNAWSQTHHLFRYQVMKDRCNGLLQALDSPTKREHSHPHKTCLLHVVAQCEQIPRIIELWQLASKNDDTTRANDQAVKLLNSITNANLRVFRQWENDVEKMKLDVVDTEQIAATLKLLDDFSQTNRDLITSILNASRSVRDGKSVTTWPLTIQSSTNPRQTNRVLYVSCTSDFGDSNGVNQFDSATYASGPPFSGKAGEREIRAYQTYLDSRPPRLVFQGFHGDMTQEDALRILDENGYKPRNFSKKDEGKKTYSTFKEPFRWPIYWTALAAEIEYRNVGGALFRDLKEGKLRELQGATLPDWQLDFVEKIYITNDEGQFTFSIVLEFEERHLPPAAPTSKLRRLRASVQPEPDLIKKLVIDEMGSQNDLFSRSKNQWCDPYGTTASLGHSYGKMEFSVYYSDVEPGTHCLNRNKHHERLRKVFFDEEPKILGL